jgi:hypothetical protein
MNKDNFSIGVGRRCITPPMPVGLAGYFNVRMWDHVLDDIEVRVIIFESDGNLSAIIQYDLIAVSPELEKAFRDKLAESGISGLQPGENIITTAIHTHTAPEVRSARGGFNPDYISFAAEKTVEALKDAIDDLEPGSVEYGITKNNRFAFNRRYWMINGEVATNPGKLNPEIDRPEGEIDPEIPLLIFKCNDRIKALIANIVNHSDTIGGNDISGDWAGFTIKTLQRKFGVESMVVPLIGCSGNINHFNVKSDVNQTCYAEAERIGTGYAESIGKALSVLYPMKNANLKTYSQQISIPPRILSPAEIEDARKIIEKYPEIDVDKVGGPDLTAEDLARKTPYALKYFAVNLLKTAENSKTTKFNLVRIDIGSAVIASVPCEPFVEIGLTIRKGILGDRTVMVASLSNGSGTGYIPNCWNYGRGGYETTPRSSPYSIETSELLLSAWRKLAEK